MGLFFLGVILVLGFFLILEFSFYKDTYIPVKEGKFLAFSQKLKKSNKDIIDLEFINAVGKGGPSAELVYGREDIDQEDLEDILKEFKSFINVDRVQEIEDGGKINDSPSNTPSAQQSDHLHVFFPKNIFNGKKSLFL